MFDRGAEKRLIESIGSTIRWNRLEWRVYQNDGIIAKGFGYRQAIALRLELGHSPSSITCEIR
jgi:hypothetical protein